MTPDSDLDDLIFEMLAVMAEQSVEEAVAAFRQMKKACLEQVEIAGRMMEGTEEIVELDQQV